ncbi:hypothetical protein ACNS7O_07740 [Haloferacaceae archaeon DSL9]
MAANGSLPLWWILVFFAVTLGVAVAVVFAVGGNPFPGMLPVAG